jgi:GH15 family glucan-1,4-alpha-glucosidase
MPRIEDYALIGDMQTAALVGSNGSIDWLCLPHFASGACFAALLGTREHGRWQIAPAGDVVSVRRRYRGASLVLETELTTSTGTVRLVDCMPPREEQPDIVRIVEGVAGNVEMIMDLVIRFDYGSIVPWVRTIDGVLHAIGGPDALALWAPVACEGVGLATRAVFTVAAGDTVPFVLVWHPSNLSAPPPIDARKAVEDCEAWWREWTRHYAYEGPWREQVLRSAITLKALTFAPTGGIVAGAPTACATGTTAIAGSAMRPSRCTR